MSVIEIQKSPAIEAMIERRKERVAIRQERWEVYVALMDEHRLSGRKRRRAALVAAERVYDEASYAADRASMDIEMLIRQENPEAPQAAVMRAWQAWA